MSHRIGTFVTMARALRIDEPGGWHHVMSRGRNHHAIFVDDLDRRCFLEIVAASCEKAAVEIHAFALMGNHYHLLMRCPNAGLSKAMQRINGLYVRHVNWRHGYDGALFKGRFRSLTVETPAYLVELARYIHRNPVAAGIVSSAADFRWSSHNSYLGGAGVLDDLVTDEILRYFNGDRSRFNRFVNADDSVKARTVMEAIDEGHPTVGGDTRLVSVADKRQVCDETEPAVRRLVQPLRIQAVENWLAVRLGVTVAELTDRASDSRQLPVLLAVLRHHNMCSLSEAAQRYGYARHSSVTSAITRLIAEPSAAAQIDQLAADFARLESRIAA